MSNNPPEITLRLFRGELDYAGIAAALTLSERADHNERQVTGEDIANAYQHLANCDPFTDIVIAAVNGEVVGYSRGWWEDELPTARFYKHNGFIIPEWRRKGIGKAMLAWMEGRLREISAAHPPEYPKIFQVSVSQHQSGTAVMLERAGYQVTRHFYNMVRPNLDDIALPPLPEGIELRPAAPDHYPLIWELVGETSQDEWGYKTPTEEDYREWLSSPLFQPELWQIAWDTATGKPVGTVLTYIHHDENKQYERRRGFTEGIGVARTWRRKGLAKAMIGRSLLAQKAAGMTESALVADTDSQSNVTQLYESCGFQIVKRDTIYRKEL